MPSPKLTPTFCMEDMDTSDMPDTMDIPMVDMPTLDKLLPLISKWTAKITGGATSGRVGTIMSRERHQGSFDIVHVKD